MSTEKERLEKPKLTSQIKHIPKDAQVIMSILRELNIQEHEPRVVNQLLEFVYRYITCILDDAKAFANHGRKKTIDLDDVKLATDVVLDKAFTCPPPRHVLAKLAEVKNSLPLPPIKHQCGLRLPPDRYCLSACNYKLRASSGSKKMTKTAIEGRSTIKTQIKQSAGNNTTSKRQLITANQSQVVTIPKPVIKFTTAKQNSGDRIIIANDSSNVKMELDPSINTTNINNLASSNLIVGMKRSREDDGFEIVQ